jgi:hypothetical protein
MRLCFKRQPLAADGCDTDYVLRSSRGTKVSQSGVRPAAGPGPRVPTDYPGCARVGGAAKTPSTDASRQSNRISSLSWFLTLELCVEPPSSSCGKGSQTHWVGRKPGSRGSGLAAAGPRVVASLWPQRTIAANACAEGTPKGHFVLARAILAAIDPSEQPEFLVFLFSTKREEEPVTLRTSKQYGSPRRAASSAAGRRAGTPPDA